MASRPQASPTAPAWAELLTELLAEGIVLSGPGPEVRYASPLALNLLGVSDPASLAARWKEVRAGLPDPPAREELELGGQAILLRGATIAPGGAEFWLVDDTRRLRALDEDLGLASRARANAELYRGLVHDLKAPLQAMVLNLDLLRQELVEAGDGAAAGGALVRIETVSQELSRFSRTLQAYLGQTRVGRRGARRFELRRVAREVARLIDPQAQRQGVLLSLELPDHPVRCSGERDRLKQALVNLALNGLEASPGGRSLVLRLLDAGGGRAALEVQDEGPGIPPAMRHRIYRMHATTKEQGSGIGLTVARAVAEEFGGELSHSDRPGGGCIARLLLPVDP